MKRVIFAGMVLVSSMFAADGAALYKNVSLATGQLVKKCSWKE